MKESSYTVKSNEVYKVWGHNSTAVILVRSVPKPRDYFGAHAHFRWELRCNGATG